ncbi:MAG: ATP-binding protein [Rhodanobacter sp.]|jgi:signal transduction histidine kinase/ActR/RegA family two-component response regulator/streptogramin lyase|nr:ATP-binding protein [Rhodanobacter sp.]
MLASLVLSAILAVASSTFVSNGVATTGGSGAVATTLPTPQFRRFEIADGLPGGAMYSLAQDHNGLMWFGSAGGLVRYDGVSFKVFRHVAGDPDSLPANSTYTLLVDRDNRIWTGGVSSGLTVYDQSTGRFRHWEHDDQHLDSLADNEVWSIAQTTDGALWVATQDGLDRMRPDGSGFDHVPLDIGATHVASFGTTRALLAESDGRLWIGAESGLYLRNADGSLHRVPVDPAFHGDMRKIWAIEGGNGEVRVALEGGLLIIGTDGVARPVARQALSSLRIMSSARDRQGRLWIGKPDGLLLDAGDGHLQSIDGHPLLPGGLPGNKTWQTFIDREGGLWIAFDESCIAYLPPGWDGFSRFTHVPDDKDSLSEVAASTIRLSHDGKLWVGGEDGWIDKLDAATGDVQHVLHGLHTQIVALAEDARRRLWIAVPGGLRLFDHGKLETIDLERTALTRPVLLAAAGDGKVYVASWGQGVFVIDADTRTITPVPAEAGGGSPPMPEQLSFRGGSVWYACMDGLMRLDSKTGKLMYVPGVPRADILMFDFDASGIWLATGHLLEHYRYADGRAVRNEAIDVGHAGMTSDLMAMRVDRQGELWLFGNPGLWRLDRVTHRLRSFGPDQGLANAAFGDAVTAMAPDGTIFAPDSTGLVAFLPRQFMRPGKPLAPAQALTLTGLRVRRDGKDRSLPLDGSVVQLGWRDRDLKVDARLASFINPAADHYRFRLSGFDGDWVDVDSRGEREFAGLGAGDYTLEVKAAGPDGVWSRLAVPLRIRVQAPPWARWWAWTGYALLLASLVVGVLQIWRRRLAQHHRLQLMEQQRQLAEAASAAKTQFLATLSHEIRTPMTGVMGMAELLLSTPLSPLQKDYTQAMQRSGGMLLKLLNDSLDLARIEAGRMELEPAPFDPRQLLGDVSQIEQGLAHTKGIRFVLEIEDDLQERVIGDALRIKQVLLNLANNALKFTEHGHVTLRGQRAAGGVLFSISDTGPGIPEASQSRLFQRFEQEDSPQRGAGSGLGLAICRELVDMMEGSIELESRLGHGSTFRVRLPLAEPPPTAPPPSIEATAGRGYRLLLVEDDMIVAAVIRGLLEHQGHAVSHVANGLAALTELAHDPFDAVLLDLDLPGVDGFQIARLIRQRERGGPSVPIIAVTARSGSEDEARARAAGMDGFLRKPLSGEQLAVALAMFGNLRASVADEPA